MPINLPPAGQDLSVDFAAVLPFGDVVYGAIPLAQGTIAATAVAINPNIPGLYLITLGSAAASTLAAPTATNLTATPPVPGSDYKIIRVMSTTAYAHTITTTGLLKTGSASVNVATYAAFAGAHVTLMAYQGFWYVIDQVGITFS